MGTERDDQIVGTNRSDVIVAGKGHDRISGLGGNDLICGGDGRDIIRSGEGTDRVDGGTGSDRIFGGAGNDVLRGRSGRDVVVGGPGTDLADGGNGHDACFTAGQRRSCEKIVASVATTSTLEALQKPSGGSLRIGVTGASIPWETNDIDTFEAVTGQSPDMIHGFFRLDAPVPVAEFQARADEGHLIVVTLEPWAGSQSSLQSINSGAFDADFQRWARELSTLEAPVVVRWMHELNGTWYPWSVGASDGTPQRVIDAYRRGVTQMRATSSNDVIFAWSPNVGAPDGVGLQALWPGAGFVDVVGLDGYNGASVVPSMGGWRSFQATFSNSVNNLASLTSKPLIIFETAAAEDPSRSPADKAAWITAGLAWAHDNTKIDGVLWFQVDKSDVGEANWKFDSSIESSNAFRDAVNAVRLTIDP